jgi:hypothetical protein
MQPRKPPKKEEEEEGKATAEARLHDEMMARELNCEGGSGALPVPRSAVPAGTQARHLLTYVRTPLDFLGGRLRGGTQPGGSTGRSKPLAGGRKSHQRAKRLPCTEGPVAAH